VNESGVYVETEEVGLRARGQWRYCCSSRPYLQTHVVIAACRELESSAALRWYQISWENGQTIRNFKWTL